jgi:hypothetical protein
MTDKPEAGQGGVKLTRNAHLVEVNPPPKVRSRKSTRLVPFLLFPHVLKSQLPDHTLVDGHS